MIGSLDYVEHFPEITYLNDYIELVIVLYYYTIVCVTQQIEPLGKECIRSKTIEGNLAIPNSNHVCLR